MFMSFVPVLVPTGTYAYSSESSLKAENALVMTEHTWHDRIDRFSMPTHSYNTHTMYIWGMSNGELMHGNLLKFARTTVAHSNRDVGHRNLFACYSVNLAQGCNLQMHYCHKGITRLYTYARGTNSNGIQNLKLKVD